MLASEATWISKFFSERSNDEIGTVLNIGSSTAEFREEKQGFINEKIFRPLARRGVPVIHSDIKAAHGVDIVADIMNDDDLQRLCGLGVRTVICSNMLEHVPYATQMAERLAMLVPPGGSILVTVPNSYPYHPDPIDTMLRPDTQQLSAMFQRLSLQSGCIVEGPTAAQEFAENPALLPRRVARSFIPLPKFGIWLSTIDRWRWLFRRYKATCVVLSRPVAN